MSIQYADDYKGYGTNTSLMLDGLYSSVGAGLVEDPDPNVTGNVLQLVGFGNNCRRPLSALQTTVGLASRFWFPNLPGPGNTFPFFRALNTAGSTSIAVCINSVGQLSVQDGSSNTLASSAGPVITANAWGHIELKIVCSATLGTVEVRVNGVSVLTGTGLNTGVGMTQIETRYSQISNGSQFGTLYVKDSVVWDGSGTQNNDFLGTVSVVDQSTVSDVSFNWAASTGTTGYNLIDNSPPVDGSSYITAINPPPAASTFGLSALPADVTSVKALIVQIRARKVDGGDGTLQSGLVSGASTTSGADRPITTAFTYYEDVFEIDPATSSSWTITSANAAKLKVNRTT